MKTTSLSFSGKLLSFCAELIKINLGYLVNWNLKGDEGWLRAYENAQMDEGWKKNNTERKKTRGEKKTQSGVSTRRWLRRKGKRESHCALKRGQKKRASRLEFGMGKVARGVRHL